MEDTPLESTPAPSLPKRQINKRFIYLVVAIVVLLLLFIGIKALNSNKSSNLQQIPSQPSPSVPTDTPTPLETSTPTPTNKPTPTETPTPKPTGNPVDNQTGLDRSQLSVTVENGSGQAGVAGSASDTLKSLGYDVVGTQNADNFDYTNVTIQVKSGSSNYLNLLKSDLSSANYTIGSATSDLPDSFSSDALVIIGQ